MTLESGPTPEEIGAVIDPTGFTALSRERRKAAIAKARNVQALYAEWGGWTKIKEAPKSADALVLANSLFALVGFWDENWKAWRVGQRSQIETQRGEFIPTHFRLIGRLPPTTETRYQ